jgi:pimeloyl-ACP methyl ester carboxylesterase
LGELRSPNTRRAKIIVVVLAILVFSFLSLGALGGFFLVRALTPLQAGESIDPTRFLGNAQTVEFTGPDGLQHGAWFFPGLRTAPVLVLCHGYKSSRSEILTLATSLQQHRYNVFVFNFSGHGESPVGYTTLGAREAAELRAALDMLSRRTDMDTTRMGLWGYSMGAYAVLEVAAHSPRVQAIVVDSGYPNPAALLRLELHNLGAEMVPLLPPLALLEFRLASLFLGRGPDVRPDLSRLTGVAKLFIAGDDTPRLAEYTQELHAAAPPPKELVVLPRTNMASLLEEDRRNYENLVVSFFLRNLPLGGAGR